MNGEWEHKGLAALKAYVCGDSSEVAVMSDLKGFPRDGVTRLLQEHRAELEAIDPARHVILESILPLKR